MDQDQDSDLSRLAGNSTEALSSSCDARRTSNAFRWVTFEDLLDDALEEGKLSPTNFIDSHRRKSFPSSSSQVFSNSVSSDSSFGSAGDGGRQCFSFSQSFGGTQSGSKHQFSKLRKCLRSDSYETTITKLVDLQVSTVSETSTPTLRKPGADGQSGHEQLDKYEPFRRLSGTRYKGWSSKVLGDGQNGWTDELLGCPSSDESSDEVFVGRTGCLEVHVEEEPWYQGHGFKVNSWDKSPVRTFLRNFP